MPTNESDELAAIRQTAELMTDANREDITHSGTALSWSAAHRIEQALWSAYALACEAEAVRELHGQEATPTTA